MTKQYKNYTIWCNKNKWYISTSKGKVWNIRFPSQEAAERKIDKVLKQLPRLRMEAMKRYELEREIERFNWDWKCK